ncbi:hypothetical protein [Paenibacillus macquariensis]|uniref:Tyr recombinase domain-containing protein n=1 Tax=Paenibacillus macquariensis TaxID=948756 RepID=A0ABY1JW75_9BACL|nr:hypothetical protein [Paenibacillus macquariensis]MEC0093468.1 hypothetical protein [Paenibacillus macquariensis]OAB34398.1 hypothetical protein PMSM_11000 [Paenibacillus macquariensis subsp. macquariensis]SIQ87410.1 hypothetical protein SAMN05421578_104435 [Paenibacillus macquariensis]
MNDKSHIAEIFQLKSDNIRFVLVPVWLEWMRKRDGSIIEKQVAAIGLKNVSKDIHIIHGLSAFILGEDSRWRTKKYNTQRKHVSNVIQFLNYLIKNKKRLKLTKLSDLTIQLGTDFLTDLSFKKQEVHTEDGIIEKEISINKKTVLSIGRTLTYFYVWLHNNELLPNVDGELLQEFKRKNHHNNEYYYESIFEPIYPSEQPRKLEHYFPIKYLPLLLEIAILKANPITLGIYLQVFGGLRVSEVVNIKRTQFARTVNKGDFLLNIESRNMRTDLKGSSGGGYAKKQRRQLIIQIKDWGDILYRQHLDLYKESDKLSDYTPKGALFVNFQGRALSEPSYRYYFNKLKQKFCDHLFKYGNAADKLVANHLRIIDWNTHIGRGTFTNMITEQTENIAELAFLRGDSDLMSSVAYLAKTTRARDRIENNISTMHEDYVPSLINKQTPQRRT